MNDKLKLLVVCHKNDENIRNYPPYFPIQVGKALHPELDLGFQNDNEGDNISERNPYWCELTGIYWGWKNLKNVDYLGICHYRRYFNLDVSEENISRILKNHDMIVVKSDKIPDRTSRTKYIINTTSKEDVFLFIDTLLATYPEKYNMIYKYCYNSRFNYPYTMFIAKKHVYDEFCEFLFPVLFEVEKKMKPHGYSRLQRTMGYLGEFSLGLFVLMNNLNVYTAPIEQTDVMPQSLKDKFVHSTGNFLKTIAYTICNRPPKGITLPPEVKVGFKADGIELKVLK